MCDGKKHETQMKDVNHTEYILSERSWISIQKFNSDDNGKTNFFTRPPAKC
jgi:hypothetical protein